MPYSLTFAEAQEQFLLDALPVIIHLYRSHISPLS